MRDIAMEISICKLPEKMAAVYIFGVGDLFYIGRSIDVRSRFKQHHQRIRFHIQNYALIANRLIRNPKNCTLMYLKIARYIHEHPKVKHIRMVDVTFHNSHIGMCAHERRLLRMYEKHPDCTNHTFAASVFDKELRPIKQFSSKIRKEPEILTRPTKAQLLAYLKQLRAK